MKLKLKNKVAHDFARWRKDMIRAFKTNPSVLVIGKIIQIIQCSTIKISHGN